MTSMGLGPRRPRPGTGSTVPLDVTMCKALEAQIVSHAVSMSGVCRRATNLACSTMVNMRSRRILNQALWWFACSVTELCPAFLSFCEGLVPPKLVYSQVMMLGKADQPECTLPATREMSVCKQ